MPKERTYVACERRPANPGAGQICTFQKWKCVGGNSSTRRMAHDIFGRMSQEHTGDYLFPTRVPIRTNPNISRHRWTPSQNASPCAGEVRPVGPEGVERYTCDVRVRPSFRSREKVVAESSSFSLPLPPCLLPSFFFASCVVWSEI